MIIYVLFFPMVETCQCFTSMTPLQMRIPSPPEHHSTSSTLFSIDSTSLLPTNYMSHGIPIKLPSEPIHCPQHPPSEEPEEPEEPDSPSDFSSGRSFSVPQ